MKMNTSFSRYAAIPVLAVLLFSASCKKDSSQPANNALAAEQVVEAGANEVIMQSTFDDVFDNAAGIDGATAGENLGIYGGTGFGLFPGQASGINTEQTNTRCFTVTVTPKDRGVFPKTVVIDFGNGCEGHGHIRKGKIITVYTGPLHIPGNSAVTSFDGFHIDSFLVEGKHTILNSTESGGNQRSFTRKVENAKLTNVNTNFWRSWSGTHVMLQLEGNGSPLFPLDDIYQFTGNKKGETSNGRTWTATIVKPLIKAFICRWISKGSIEISVNGTVGVLDFGNGDCDNTATITINGVSREITLR
jgi:hypothetical protein